MYSSFLAIPERSDPDRSAVRRDRHRPVPICAVELDACRAETVDHGRVRMPEPIPIPRGDDGQAWSDRGDEARAAAGLAAMVRDLEDVGGDLAQPALRPFLDVSRQKGVDRAEGPFQ